MKLQVHFHTLIVHKYSSCTRGVLTGHAYMLSL